jgi:hypothetical protein
MLAPLSAPDRALIAQVVTDLPGVWPAPTTTLTVHRPTSGDVHHYQRWEFRVTMP